MPALFVLLEIREGRCVLLTIPSQRWLGKLKKSRTYEQGNTPQKKSSISECNCLTFSEKMNLCTIELFLIVFQCAFLSYF